MIKGLDSLGAQAHVWVSWASQWLPGIVLIVKMDGLEALAHFRAPWTSKLLPGHRFHSENEQFGNSGMFLGVLGFERDPRASFWYGSSGTLDTLGIEMVSKASVWQ